MTEYLPPPELRDLLTLDLWRELRGNPNNKLTRPSLQKTGALVMLATREKEK